ncbi:MAG: hypothetical protein HOO96_34485 [Polyangiaceae bacterium]|nr:hypothetical protein [Polyangiaceae bacterium]
MPLARLHRLLCIVFPLATTACVSGNHYLTGRTQDPGRIQAGAAVEVVQFGDRLAPTPRLDARVGLVPRLDMGVFYSGAFGADVRVQPIRSTWFDMALATRLHVWPMLPGAGVAWDGFAILSPNLGIVTPTVSPGFAWRLTDPSKLVPRVGLGLQLRVTDRIALAAEVTYVNELSNADAPRGLRFGLGIRSRDGDGYP